MLRQFFFYLLNTFYFRRIRESEFNKVVNETSSGLFNENADFNKGFENEDEEDGEEGEDQFDFAFRKFF